MTFVATLAEAHPEQSRTFVSVLSVFCFCSCSVVPWFLIVPTTLSCLLPALVRHPPLALGRTDERMDGRTDRPTHCLMDRLADAEVDERIDGWMNERTDGRTSQWTEALGSWSTQLWSSAHHHTIPFFFCCFFFFYSAELLLTLFTSLD